MRRTRAGAWVVLATAVAVVLLAAPAGAQETDAAPSDVDVGMFVNNIHDISLHDDRFTADVWLWFRWTDPDLHPLETFEIVEGTIDERQDVPVQFDGTTYYGDTRVIVTINKLWDVSAFPLDDHFAEIIVEDSGMDER